MTQLVQEDSQTPNIHSKSLLLLLEELRREVFSRSAHSRSRVLRVHFAGKSEISEFRVVLLVEQHVFQFDISVQNVERMEILDGLAELEKNY